MNELSDQSETAFYVVCPECSYENIAAALDPDTPRCGNCAEPLERAFDDGRVEFCCWAGAVASPNPCPRHGKRASDEEASHE